VILVIGRGSESWQFLLLSLGLLAAAVAGLVSRWGSLVFCPLAGFYFGCIWAPSPYLYAHNAHEDMMQGFGIPVIYAVVGAIVGIAAEVLPRIPQKSPGAKGKPRRLRRHGSPLP
jgi:hypothetical protein